MNGSKILLMHLVSNGDCLYTTAIARQIKKDFPGYRLTWLISSNCSQVLLNNPDIDEIREVKVESVKDALFDGWNRIKGEIQSSGFFNEFDYIFYTQFFPENIHHYDGTIRSTLFRSYAVNKVKDVRPVVHLTESEIYNAKRFVTENRIREFEKVILFECSPGSGQSFVNPDFAVEISRRITERHPNVLVILSTHLHLKVTGKNILVANTLTFRENAELANHCDLFLGCSSGITWLCTSNWANPKMPMIQLLSKAKGIAFASVAYDFDYWGLDSSHITEIYKKDQGYILSAIEMFFQKGPEACKSQFHESVKPDPFHMKDYFNMVAKKGDLKKVFGLFNNFRERNGFSIRLLFAFGYFILQGIFRIPFVLVKDGIKLKSKN